MDINKMTDIASIVNATHAAEENFARAADNYSTRIEQTLRMIKAVEKNLREKRKRVEEIQTRHEDLALQYRQLGTSLDSATADLTQQFAGVISDLGNDGAISKLLAVGASTTVVGSNLTPEKSELPPVPECVREIQDSSNDDETNLDPLQSAFIRKLKNRRRSNSKSAHRK
jgi:exonuclease VII large subunit